MVQEYIDVFPEPLSNGRPPKRYVEHMIKVELDLKPPRCPLIVWALQRWKSWSVRSKTCSHRDLSCPAHHPTSVLSLKRTTNGGVSSTIMHETNKRVKNRFPLSCVNSFTGDIKCSYCLLKTLPLIGLSSYRC